MMALWGYVRKSLKINKEGEKFFLKHAKKNSINTYILLHFQHGPIHLSLQNLF